jgi:predicted nucleic acid-binding protein
VTTDLVFDSSVMVKLVVPEVDSAKAAQIMQDVPAAGGQIIAVDIGLIEVAQALWKLFHRRKLTAAEVARRLAVVETSVVQFVPARPLLSAAVDLALRYDRAVYDMLFVALAIDRGLTGVTADEPLARAVQADYPQIVLLST